MDWHFLSLKFISKELNQGHQAKFGASIVNQSVDNSIFLNNFKLSANIRNLDSGMTNLRPLTDKENIMGINDPFEEHRMVHRLF